MKKVTTFVAIAALGSQLAAPAFAMDMSGGMFNRTTVLGLQRTNGAAAMAYFQMPLGQTARLNAPRVGLRFAGPQTFMPGESHLHLAAPQIADFSLTGRNLTQPWEKSSWTATFSVGDTVAWTNDKSSLPPGHGPALFESGISWVAVGALTVGAVAGAFALTNRKK